MNSRQKETAKAQLEAEKKVLDKLERQYNTALNDINQKIKLFDYDINMLDQALNEDGLDAAAKAVLRSRKRSKIYQKQYQEAMKGQVNGILDKLHGDEYATIQQYLKDSYTDAFVGTAYDLAGQGIPLIMPIDQAAVVKAVQTDSKVSKGLYNALGVDVAKLKKSIQSEISRGIATGMSYADMARNISNVSKAPLNRANVIARTEGHRIQNASTMDAQRAAKKKGADVVKQWDSTLDGKTRPAHRQLDGQIREVDEPFEVDGMKADAPGYFGDPAEDCNCRCACLTRARWALDEDELQTLKDRAEYYGLDKTKNFDDFKEKYLKASEEESKIQPEKYNAFQTGEEANQFFYYDDYEKSHGLMARKNSEHGKWQRGLSDSEKECISDYTGGGYYDLNNYLRKVGDWQSIDAEKEEYLARNIDSAISKYKLKDNIVVQRGVMTDVIDMLAEKYDIQNSLSELVGKKYVDNAFTSTTVLKGNGVATSKPVVMDIEIPAGTGRGAYVNQLAGQYQDAEYEFLVKRGASFTIKEVVEEEVMGEYRYYVKMVMDVE